ncbi:peptidoglycan recognition family protein [Paratractidigestivibacter sp.]|uniref:peptidoglycan recognition protein family protein n=1 Tax=Paratractidigestivibacter sp. TaxID=2847316 RepID=UPI002ABE0658|nr:peptidoglycan recognition family protein [Paratractidigestivibacter sp.]
MKHKAPKMAKAYCKATHGNTVRCNRKRGTSAAPKYIVVHNTGSNASAKNNCIYFNREGARTKASADYFIDKDGSIWKYNKPQRAYSWHCGDGGGAYGVTNGNSVGIEVVSADDPFTDAQVESLRGLVQHLMEYYGIDASHLVRHWDASRKSCPGYYAGAASSAAGKRWKALKAKLVKGY